MSGWLKTLGWTCVAAAGGLCLLAATLVVRQTAWQAANADLFTGSPGVVDRPAPPEPGQPLARLKVRRIGLDVVVAEGTDRRTLLRGPGHLEGSAAPGTSDNCIIAGHRDGPFGRLAAIEEGDLVHLEDAAGASLYEVRSVSVVPGDDAALLAPSSEAILTLVTCYPIHYVGRAPQRLVVRAVLVEPPSTTAGTERRRS